MAEKEKNESTNAADKRRVERLSLNLPVDLIRLDLMETGSIDDITPQGVFIATDQELEVGERIEIQFAFPEEGQEQTTAEVTVKGEVVWNGQKLSLARREIVQGVGVRFIELDADTLDTIISLYDKLSSQVS